MPRLYIDHHIGLGIANYLFLLNKCLSFGISTVEDCRFAKENQSFVSIFIAGVDKGLES
jgi:hypothetical protein